MELDILHEDAKVIRELTIDTPSGNRQFELLYGNLLSVSTDLWVTTVYQGNGGELYLSIKELVGLHPSILERKMIPLPDGGFIGFISHPHQNVLTIHLNKKEGTAIPNDEFQEVIKAVFSAIAALTYEGYTFKEISIPVIGKKGLKQEEYEGSLKWLIQYAVNYLKDSQSTYKIKYFVHILQDVPAWERALHQLFSKNGMNPPDIDLFSASVRKEVIHLIETFPKPERPSVRKVLEDIHRELLENGSTDYSFLLDKSDLLVDLLLKDLYKLGGITSPSYLSSERLSKRKVSLLQKEEPISDWYFNYFLTIRLLKDKNYFQSCQVTPEEKVLLLILLQRTLFFYQDFYKDFYL